MVVIIFKLEIPLAIDENRAMIWVYPRVEKQIEVLSGRMGGSAEGKGRAQ